MSNNIRRIPSVISGSRSARRSSSADRKSTRLNSSHDQISYAVFCLKKKKNVHLSLTAATTVLNRHTPNPPGPNTPLSPPPTGPARPTAPPTHRQHRRSRPYNTHNVT